MSCKVIYRWKCDRCGIESQDLLENERPDGWESIDCGDLCRACVAAFNAWFRKESEE